MVLHMIDGFPRFSAGAIITSKAVASKSFMQHWIAILGAAWKIFSEFIGDLFANMCEKFNIKIQTTPSKSP